MSYSVDIDTILDTYYDVQSKGWKENAREMAQYAKRWIPGLKVRFQQQKAEVLRNMGIEPGKAFNPVPIGFFYLEFYDWDKWEMKADGSEYLFDLNKWRVNFEEFGQLILPGIIGEHGQNVLGDIIAGLSFDVYNPRVTTFIENVKFKFAFDVNYTTEQMLRKEFALGLEAGEDIRQLSKRVEKVFDFSEKYRSVRIARTETGSAYNFGSLESYRQSGVVQKKEWLATNDMRTRDEHWRMNGQKVPLNETFSNGGMYPGDPSLPAEQRINCRCSLAAVVEEKETQ